MEHEQGVLVSPRAEVPVVEGEMVTAIRELADRGWGAKPWQNGVDESFNGKFRHEHLSLQWCRNRAEAAVSIEQWRHHYNEVRPHSSLA